MENTQTRDRILVISSYPKRGSIHSAETVGVAYYTKSVLQAMHQAKPDLRVTELAEQLPGEPKSYTEKGVKVRRVWKRGNLPSIIRLFAEISRMPEKKVAISFEINMFGKPWHTGAALLGLLGLRLSGKHTYLIVHQVLSDFKTIGENTAQTRLLNAAKALLYRLIRMAASEIVVFEEQFKLQLGARDRVTTVPLFVPSVGRQSQRTARRKLGLKTTDRYILYFGFLAPYKGIDLLLKNWPRMRKTHLIVAGGANPNHSKNKKYQQFLKKVELLAAKRGISLPGFIPEKDLPLYFAACDAVILPYRTFMSSSAPLSLAWSYQKPVLLAKPLAGYAKSPDIKQALRKAQLSITDLLFSQSTPSLTKALQSLEKHDTALREFARTMRKLRAEKKIALRLAEVFSYER